MNSNLPINKDLVVGLIPARGDSKSIPLKNLVLLNGIPLIHYVINSALDSSLLSYICCSTDNKLIAEECNKKSVHVIERPKSLGQDDTQIIDVIRHSLSTFAEEKGFYPEMVALLQPTSPFITPNHIDSCISILQSDKMADSSQTISKVFHNAHAFNQRIIIDGRVQFKFIEERAEAYNKQRKPQHFLFGNLVVSRTRSIFNHNNCFGQISLPLEIDRLSSIDIDTIEDIDYANYVLQRKSSNV